MARFICQGNWRDGNGKVISGGTLIVYLADTSTPATIKDAKSGGSTITGASITTDTEGYFKFYVDDGDHAASQLFDLTFTKTGFVTKTYEDVKIVL